MATRDVRNFKFLKEAIIQKFRNPENPSFKGIRYEPVANPNSIFGRIYTTFRELIDKKHLDLKQYLNIGDKSVLNRLYLNLKKDSNLKFLDDPDSTLNDQKYELPDQYFQGQSKDVTAAQQAEPAPIAHAGMPGAPAITTTPSQPRFIHNIPQSLTPTQTESTNTPTEKAIKSDREPVKPEVPQAFPKAFEGEPAEVLHPDRQPVPEAFNKAFENEPPLNPDKQTSLKTNPFTKTSAINPGVRFQSDPSDIFKTTRSKTGTFFKTNSNRVAGSLGDIFKGIGRGIAGPGVSGLYNAGAKLGNGGINAIERLSKPGGAGGGGGIGKLSKSSNKLALGFLGIFFLIVLLGGLFGATSGITPSTGTMPTTGTASSCLPVGDPNGYIQKVGFLPKDNTGYPFAHPTSYSSAFNIAAQKARSAAANFSEVDPVLLVWWVFFETGAKYDSYSYSNCLDNNRDVNTNCSSVSSGNWQLGYGQQYATIGRLVEAFQKTHGDPTDANLTQQVGQNVLNQAGQASHTPFPNTSVSALLADTSQDAQYWKSVLMRDPDISMYLLAYVFSSYAGQNLREITAQWGSHYTEMWQKASNLLSDILTYNQTNCQTQSPITPPISGVTGVTDAAAQITTLLYQTNPNSSYLEDRLFHNKRDEPSLYYWCTLIVVDAYNKAGFTGLTRAAHAGVLNMKSFFANTSGYQLLPSDAPVEQLRPGDAIFFEGNDQHVSLVKSIEVSQEGNGIMRTYEANNVVLEDIVFVQNHKATGAQTTIGKMSITGFGQIKGTQI